jgi:uncharacterized membrane protein
VITLCGYVANTISVYGSIMMYLAPLHVLAFLLVGVLPALIGLLILYCVIRLAVRHGIRDARKK